MFVLILSIIFIAGCTQQSTQGGNVVEDSEALQFEINDIPQSGVDLIPYCISNSKFSGAATGNVICAPYEIMHKYTDSAFPLVVYCWCSKLKGNYYFSPVPPTP